MDDFGSQNIVGQRSGTESSAAIGSSRTDVPRNRRQFLWTGAAHIGVSILGLSAIVSSLTLGTGCATWRTEDETKDLELPKPKLPVDAVVVEVQFLRIAEEDAAGLEQIWQIADEQLLDLQVRRRLQANGIRAGLITGDYPVIVQQWIQSAKERLESDTLEQANVASQVSMAPQQLSCRAGKRKELLVQSIQNQVRSIVYNQDGAIHGRNCDAPEFLFDLRAVPHGDGRATISLTPEIKHGQVRNVFVGREAAFHYDWQREKINWEELTVQLNASPGQTIVLTCTDPPRGLGKQFFVAQSLSKRDERVLLMLRLSATQLDELFAPDQLKEAERAAQR